MATNEINPAPHLSALRMTVYYFGKQYEDALVTKKEPGWVHWQTHEGKPMLTPAFATVCFDRPPFPGCSAEGDAPCLKHAAAVADAMLATPEAKRIELDAIPGERDMSGPDADGPIAPRSRRSRSPMVEILGLALVLP